VHFGIRVTATPCAGEARSNVSRPSRQAPSIQKPNARGDEGSERLRAGLSMIESSSDASFETLQQAAAYM
jgi:hypothetical protein